MKVPLDTLPVLAIDCQATGAGPHNGRLMEIGWATVIASRLGEAEDPPVTVLPAALPDNTAIPRPIQRLTGLSPEDLMHATPPAAVWAQLTAAARRAGAAAGLKRDICW